MIGSLLHAIKWIPHRSSSSSEEQENNEIDGFFPSYTASEGAIVNDDDFPSGRRRRKREIIEDVEGASTERVESYSRPARDLSWYQRSFSEGVKRKRSESNQYYVEILIVVDKHMYEYHKTSEALIHYILTLMSHVSIVCDLPFPVPFTSKAINRLVLIQSVARQKRLGWQSVTVEVNDSANAFLTLIDTENLW